MVSCRPCNYDLCLQCSLGKDPTAKGCQIPKKIETTPMSNISGSDLCELRQEAIRKQEQLRESVAKKQQKLLQAAAEERERITQTEAEKQEQLREAEAKK